jgi:hypothetical protein
MFKRLKRALVESYIGAIALGYLLAEAILYFIGIFSTPVGSWLAQQRFSTPASHRLSADLIVLSGLPQLINSVLLLLLWYVLLRWLYVEKSPKQTVTPAPNQEQSA